MTKIKIYPKFSHIPALEPIDLAEAKLYLRVTNNKEDSLIMSLVKSVRNIAENYLKSSLVSQEWQAIVNNLVNKKISLPKGPIQKIDAIFTISNRNERTLLKPNIYYLADESVILNFPIINSNLVIHYTTGYDNILNIPAAIKRGMLMHLAMIYDNRVGVGGIPKNIAEYYQPYRKMVL